MSLAAGDKLGPYEILALIGKGGMGESTAHTTPAPAATSPSKFPRSSSTSDSTAKSGPWRR